MLETILFASALAFFQTAEIVGSISETLPKLTAGVVLILVVAGSHFATLFLIYRVVKPFLDRTFRMLMRLDRDLRKLTRINSQILERMEHYEIGRRGREA